MRLVAGQTEKGGWDYRCPLLTPQDMHQLITYLQKTKPKVALQLPRKDDPYQPPNDVTVFQQFNQGAAGGKQPSDQPSLPVDQKGKGDQPASKDQPTSKGADQGTKGPDQDSTGSPQDPAKKSDEKSEPGKELKKGDLVGKEKVGTGKSVDAEKIDAKKDESVKKEDVKPATEKAAVGVKPKILPKGKAPVGAPVRPDFLPPAVRDLPAVLGKGKGKGAKLKGRDDNSNSQFALLALWAARRARGADGANAATGGRTVSK